MQRVVIIAKGDVQGVGYRSIVKKIARKLNIVGRVRNIKPYDVEIIAEGEKENLNNFIEKIRVKESPVNVEKLEVRSEEPTNEFDYFDIERGDLEEELGERLDIARDVMNKMIEKQEQTISEIKTFREESGDKQDKMLEKQDQMREELGEKIDYGFSKMDQNFSTLRQDYGKNLREDGVHG